MSDVLIRLSAAARRRNWWRTALLVLVLAGGMVALGLSERAPVRWWWVGGFGAFGLVAVCDMINRIYGSAALTAEGIEFRTFVSRRSISWDEITGIEKRVRSSRSGVWWDLRVVRVRGRSLAVPGTFTKRTGDGELDRKLVLMHEHWCRALDG
ncbi:hypothetical protein OG204_00080 [Streptomyces sp. NBC_01387]|uniref:hypothetical protein n=1 Tax=unclassified Streptomyces TaxID=2593676 RepID=UPI00325457E5